MQQQISGTEFIARRWDAVLTHQKTVRHWLGDKVRMEAKRYLRRPLPIGKNFWRLLVKAGRS